MKKTYIIPRLVIRVHENERPVAVSGVFNSDYKIDYGGVDESGEMDPNVKENAFSFDWE